MPEIQLSAAEQAKIHSQETEGIANRVSLAALLLTVAVAVGQCVSPTEPHSNEKNGTISNSNVGDNYPEVISR